MDDFDAYTTHKHPGNPVTFDSEKRDLHLQIAALKEQTSVYVALAAAQSERAEKAERELAEAGKDAERYRWLRGRISGREYREIGLEYGEIVDVDALIDAALGGNEPPISRTGRAYTLDLRSLTP